MEGLLKAANMSDEDCAKKAAEAISEVVSVGYDYITEFVQPVGELTFQLIQANRKEEVSHIMRFW